METSFSSRMKIIAEMVGNATLLAEKAGISRRTIGFYLAGKIEPPLSKLVKIAELANVRVAWLATGEGPPCREDVSGICKLYMQRTCLAETHVVLPQRRRPELKSSDALAFSKEWLEKEIAAGTADLGLLAVGDDAMAPAIHRGDLILVDMAAKRLAADGIYVLRLGDAVQVRRLQILLTGKVSIQCDNLQYERERADIEDVEQRLIGRVVWFGRRL